MFLFIDYNNPSTLLAEASQNSISHSRRRPGIRRQKVIKQCPCGMWGDVRRAIRLLKRRSFIRKIRRTKLQEASSAENLAGDKDSPRIRSSDTRFNVERPRAVPRGVVQCTPNVPALATGFYLTEVARRRTQGTPDRRKNIQSTPLLASRRAMSVRSAG